MAGTRTVQVPVRYVARDGSGNPRNAVTPVDLEVRVLEDSEAPVVATQERGEQYTVKKLDYRLYDGVLWSRNVIFDYPLDPPEGGWNARTLSQFETWHRAYHHPLLPDNDRLPHAYGKTLNDVSYEPKATREPAFLARLEQVRRMVDEHFILDGVVWGRCYGPVLQYHALSRTLEFRHVEDVALTFTNDFNDLYFDPFDPGEVMDRIEAATGQRPVLDKAGPQFLSREGYRIDTLPLAAEGLAWGLLWMSRRARTCDVPPGYVGAIAELREAMTARWPDVALDFNLRQFSDAMKPFSGREIPDPAPLLPVLERAVEASVPLSRTKADLVAWEMGLSRLRQSMEDEHVLAGMVL